MIAIDVMGGDFAPEAPLRGALAAAQQKIPVCLFGSRAEIVKFLDSTNSNWSELPIKIYDTTQVIEMDEEPVLAVKKKPSSSLVKAVESVAKRECSAVISAGNSGALMAASTFILGRQNGIERPAIAGFLPTKKSSVLCLDLGANTDCKASYLLQFAQLGSDYISSFAGIENPKIGLLSNGSESTKGSLAVKEAHSLLANSKLNFIGNVEPEDVIDGIADVVVCDGFAGNIMLKTMEAVSCMIYQWAEQNFENEQNNTGKYFCKMLYDRTSWVKQGGALLLGVKGNVVVAHGKACEKAIENAIILAWKTSQSSMKIGQVTQALAERIA